jgi:hypothetical protein
MKMWIQVSGQEADEEFSDNATYQVLPSGVLRVNSGGDIYLYSPSYWQQVTIDTRSADQRDQYDHQLDADLSWQ